MHIIALAVFTAAWMLSTIVFMGLFVHSHTFHERNLGFAPGKKQAQTFRSPHRTVRYSGTNRRAKTRLRTFWLFAMQTRAEDHVQKDFTKWRTTPLGALLTWRKSISHRLTASRVMEISTQQGIAITTFRNPEPWIGMEFLISNNVLSWCADNRLFNLFDHYYKL